MLPARAYSFISLNLLRALSIVALLLVFSSNIVILAHDVQAVNRFQAGQARANSGTNQTVEDMLDADYIIDSTVPNQPAGIFWAVLNRLLIVFQVIVLFLSELGWPSAFFNRFFPIIGTESFGVGPLGFIQCLLGAAILSHRVDRFSLVSAFFLFSIGCLNILVGLIFRESAKAKRSVTSWREQSKSVLPTHIPAASLRPDTTGTSSFVSNVSSAFEKTASYTGNEGKIGYGFGVQGEKAAGLKGYLITKPIESLPRYSPARTPTV
ncbi:hypothetical protein MKEN_01350700 [Mycena kentingensis (nom. inval.)]|nr:hypothetical protein MKEN_01350700 [Mycena kentingensis (nom. inval.)]